MYASRTSCLDSCPFKTLIILHSNYGVAFKVQNPLRGVETAQESAKQGLKEGTQWCDMLIFCIKNKKKILNLE